MYAKLSTPQLSQTPSCLGGITYAHVGHLKVKYCTHSQKVLSSVPGYVYVCVCVFVCVHVCARLHVCANLPVHKTKLSSIANTQQSGNVKNYQDPSHDTHRSLLPNITLMIKTYWNILCTISQFSICNCDQSWTQNYQFIASSYGSRFYIHTISKYTDTQRIKTIK